MAVETLITAALVGIYGVLCGIAGYALGKRDGILGEFRDEQRTAEVLKFMAADEEVRP